MRHLIGLAGVVLLVARCPGAPAEGVSNGTLTIASAAEFQSLNPMYVSGTNRGIIENLMFPALLGYGAHGELVPRLATAIPTLRNGGISPDGRTIVYHLRRDAHWSDGVRITARDVVFTHEAQMNAKNAAPETLGDREIDRLTASGDDVVRITLRRPYAPFITRWHRPILPAHLLAALDSLAAAPFNAHPVGSGPYRFVEWVRGDHLTFEADPAYWGERARIRRIIYKFIPNPDTLLTVLRSGEIDMVLALDPSRVQTLRDDPRTKVVTYSSHASFSMFFNTSSAVLADERVRRAIALGIDRVNAVRKATNNGVDVEHPELALFGWAYARDVHPLPYDPPAARKLLEGDGWRPGPDGTRTKDGRTLSISIATQGSYPSITTMATQMAQTLRGIGVAAELKNYVDQQMFLLTPAGTLYGGHFDVAIVRFNTDTDPDVSYLLGCDGYRPNPYNFSHLCDHELQSALDAAVGSYDRGSRMREYARVQRRIGEVVPFVLLASDVNAAVVPKALRHFDPSGGSPYWNVSSWTLQ